MRTRRFLQAGAMALAAIALGLAPQGCGPGGKPTPVQPFDRVYSAPFDAPPGVGRTSTAAPRGFRGFPWFAETRLRFAPATERLHPTLRAWLADSAASTRVRVIVGFRDPIRWPRLPVDALVRDSSGATDPLVAAQIAALVDTVRNRRAHFYEADTALLAGSFGARILGIYVLGQGVLAELPLSQLNALASRNDVVSIQPAASGDRPPECENPSGHTTLEARQEIGSPGLAGLGYGHGRLAMLDTGVDDSHALLAGLAPPAATPSAPTLQRFDCRDVSGACDGPDKGDLELAGHGHGTKTASLLVGGGVLGPAHAGATQARVESYQVYRKGDGDADWSTFDDEHFDASALRATTRNRVILAEVQSGTGPSGFVAMAANNMFYSGAVVIAAVGDGQSAWLGAPGSAAWVLSAGAYGLDAGRPTDDSQSRGIAFGRTKPDLQAPTGTLAASTDGPDCLHPHSATSGAAPYAAACALLLRNWMRSSGPSGPVGPLPVVVDPGQVYAAMIACSSDERPALDRPYALARGAGRIRLPSSGRGWWGKTHVGAFGTVTFSIPVPTGLQARHFDAAIWWTDPPYPIRLPGSAQLVQHFRYSLALTEPSGGATTSSFGPDSPFESLHLEYPRAVTGTWKLKVKGYLPGWTGAPVYWFFIARP